MAQDLNFFCKNLFAMIRDLNFFLQQCIRYGSRLRIFYHFFSTTAKDLCMDCDLDFIFCIFIQPQASTNSWFFFYLNYFFFTFHFSLIYDLNFYSPAPFLFLFCKKNMHLYYVKIIHSWMTACIIEKTSNVKSIHILLKKPFGLWKRTPHQ